ncbi:MAG: ABC transporter ATP-binding protein [Thermoplasmatota archaeon]
MPSAIVTQGLVKDFGHMRAVDGLGLEVRQGEVFGFLGPNGAGKTTSIRMMTGLLRPTKGTTHIMGELVTPGGGKARALIGVAPQENVFWENLTLLENLLFVGSLYDVPANVARDRATQLLEELGLTDKTKARAKTLSGGMKRRLNLAMALVHDPPVILLDEPEAGLDPQARLVVREHIERLRKEKTILLTTHNMDEAERVADRIAIMDHGKIIALDTPEGLKSKIGAGDVLEVRVGAKATEVQARLAARGYQATALEGVVIARGLGLAQKLPDLLREVEAAGAVPGDVRWRGNTLEDVFIHLTGRGLRE